MDVLICSRVNGSPGHYVVPGSIQSNCQDCGAPITVAPSCQAVKDSVIFICIPCGVARFKKEAPLEVKLLDGQAQEIRAWKERN